MHTWLGMYALGRLDEPEAVALRAHVDGCPDCRDELSELVPMASVLSLADPARLAEPVPAPPPTLPAAILATVERERGRRRARRLGLVAAAAAAAVALVTGGFFLHDVVPDAPDAPAGQAVAFSVVSTGVEASARVENRAWGTGISLDVAGLPPDRTYNVWLARADGSRMNAGSFIAQGNRTMSMDLAVGLPMSDATTLGVSALGDERALLQAPLGY